MTVFVKYYWCFQVITNLHVVFTMNPSSEGLKDRAATSPALFNRYNFSWMVFTRFLIQNTINNIKNLYLRCVLNWFGDWSTGALYQVGKEFTSKLDLDKSMVTINFFFVMSILWIKCCFISFILLCIYYSIVLCSTILTSCIWRTTITTNTSWSCYQCICICTSNFTWS